MNLTNVLAEFENFALVARLDKVIQAIYSPSDEVEIMTDDDRQNWIKNYAIRVSIGSREFCIFDKSLLDEGIDLEDVAFTRRIDKDETGLGKFLLKTFSPAEIYLACTMNRAFDLFAVQSRGEMDVRCVYRGKSTPFNVLSKRINTGYYGEPLKSVVEYADQFLLLREVPQGQSFLNVIKCTESADLILWNDELRRMGKSYFSADSTKQEMFDTIKGMRDYFGPDGNNGFIRKYDFNAPENIGDRGEDGEGELLFSMVWQYSEGNRQYVNAVPQMFNSPTNPQAEEAFDEILTAWFSGAYTKARQSEFQDREKILTGTQISRPLDEFITSDLFVNPPVLTFKYEGGEVKVPVMAWEFFLEAFFKRFEVDLEAGAKVRPDIKEAKNRVIECRLLNDKIVFCPNTPFDAEFEYGKPTLVVDLDFKSQSVICELDVNDLWASPFGKFKAEEIEIEDVLQLPLRAKWRQLRMPFRGKLRYLSDISLIKWAESSKSYEDAVELMNEHLSHFTTIREDGVRVGNGEMFRATEAYFMEKYAKDLTTYTQQMGNYAYCVEETFFDLNHNFGNPEKLLGYFLGMGVQPNLLYRNEVNPYRLLCARLLGIDYAINYKRLVKESIIRGNLFIQKFEGQQIVPVNPDVLLTDNWYKLFDSYSDEKFKKSAVEIFGEEDGIIVVNHHLDLLQKHKPEVMEFADDSPDDYAQMLPQFGLGNVYTTESKEGEEARAKNKQKEVTRITLPSFMPDVNIDFGSVIQNAKLLRLTSEKLTYEDFTKRESLERFYRFPVGLVDGVRIILSEGIMMSEADDKVVTGEPKRGLVKFRVKRPANPYGDEGEPKSENQQLKLDELRDEYKGKPNEWPIKNLLTFMTDKDEIALRKNLKLPPKVTIKTLQEPYYWDNYDYIVSELERLGFDLEEKVSWQGGTIEEYNQRVKDYNEGKPVNTFKLIPAKVCRIIIERASLIYKELSSYARVQGDELTSAYLATNKDERTEMEDKFNRKYNGIPDVPIEDVPIFLENMKFFGGLKNIESVRLSDKFEKEGFTNASFSLREPQRLGLRFLGANGNSGLLAHEVGFGKTTSSIAKVSDLFLRGDAKRVLVSVPKPVYDTGNWPAEIKGVKATNPSESANGLLPPYISVVQLGVMSLTDLRGKKMSIEADGEEFARLGEGSDYDGPRFYSKADLLAMEKIKPITNRILKDFGGANSKYGKTSFPYKVSDSQMTSAQDKEFRIAPVPLYKKQGKIDVAKIVRLGKKRKRWNPNTGKSENPYPNGGFFKGQKDDPFLGNGTINNNFFVYLNDVFESEGASMTLNDDGGAFNAIFTAINRVASKYEKEYSDFSQKIISIGSPKYKTSRLGGIKLSAVNAKTGSPIGNTGFIKETQVKERYDKQELRILEGGLVQPYEAKRESEYESRWTFNLADEIVLQITSDLRYILDKEQDGEDVKVDAGFWPFYGHTGYYRNVVVPWARKNALNKGELDDAVDTFKKAFPWVDYDITARNGTAKDSPEEAVEIARDELFGILEQKMITEILFLIKQLQKDIHLYLGHWKEWASQSNTIVLLAHPALSKLSSHTDEAKRASMFMNGFYDKNEPMQSMFFSKKGEIYPARSNKAQEPFSLKELSQTQRQIQVMAQFRGMNISELNVDAFMVDEAHNFNRAFKKPQKGSKVGTRIRQAFGSLVNKPKIVFDTFANYNIRAEVHNFISICFYFQKRGDKISQYQTRKLQNTIFLTATPFTDDNFQMLSLFGALSTEKLYRSGVYSLFDFFRLYVNEIWRKDIDYQGRYGLTPKIESYKNVYSMSQLIRSFTNFQISSKEIAAKRPQKVPLAVEDIVIDGKKITSKGQVGFNDAQLKMNQYLNDFVTLKSDYEIQYTEDELKEALKLYDDLEEKRGKEASKGNKVADLKKLKRLVGKESDGFPYEPENEELVNEIIDAILSVDPEDEFAQKVLQSQFFAEDDEDEIKSESGEEGEEEEALEGSVLSDVGSDELQIIAQRALASSMKQTLALVTPYYLTINNDKRLMNPLLPPLDGTMSEDAKNVVENSPKLLYACKAIAMMLEYGLDEKKQQYQGEGPNRLFGQVVFIRNYNFIYHGIRFNIFDLMIQYIIDNNKDLLERAVGKDVDLKSLFATIDSRTRKYKDKKTGQIIDEKTELVNKFNNGGVLVLFGGETIKEGINLQKNCPLMYILEMGFVPVVYMQLHGRIWRQGNPYKYAFLINVLTQNSIDTFTYSKLEEKVTSVKTMLEGDVYDANTTQFDVDVSEIKRSLITDPEKLAEMRWADIEEVLDRKRTKTESLIENLDRVQADYPEARSNYDAMLEYINIFSQSFNELTRPKRLFFIVDEMNKNQREKEIEKETTRLFEKQFFDAGVKKEDLANAIRKYNDEEYSAAQSKRPMEGMFADFKHPSDIEIEVESTYVLKKPTTRADIVARLDKGETIKVSAGAITYQYDNTTIDSKTFDLRPNSPSDAVKTGFEYVGELMYREAGQASFSTSGSRGQLYGYAYVKDEKNRIGTPSMDKVIASFGLKVVEDDGEMFVVPIGEEELVVEAIRKFEVTKDFDESWGKIAVQIASKRNRAYTCYSFTKVYRRFAGSPTENPIALLPDDARVIDLYEDSIASVIIDGKSATLDDIDEVRTQLTEELNETKRKLGDSFGQKKILEEEERILVEKRQGAIIPSVDEMVESLKQLQPYIQRRDEI